jgi:hypothetical protein
MRLPYTRPDLQFPHYNLRLQIRRWSFSSIHKLRDNIKQRFALQQWNGVNPDMRSWKKHSSEWARCQKAIGGIYYTKEWRAETLQPGLEFDNFKPQLESSVFKCIIWPSGLFFFFFWAWSSGFSERGSQDLSNGTNVASQLFSFFTSVVHGSDSCHKMVRCVY